MSISASNYLMVSRVQNRRAPRSVSKAPAFQAAGRVSKTASPARKLLPALVLLVAVALGLIGLSNQSAVATDATTPVAVSFVTVQSGQSLWSIAERVAPQSDPREWIRQVMTLNAMKVADVVAGQRLVLPQK